VERVALLSWRLHRITRYESETIALSQKRVEGGIHRRARFLRSIEENPYAATHPEDVRFEAKYSRKTHNALKRFRSLKPTNTLKGEDASSVVWAVLMVAQKTVEQKINVPLNRSAVATLKAHRLRQNEERLRLGALWED
jgi:hypothetical protein